MLRLSDLTDLPRPGTPKADRVAFHAECVRRGLDWPPLVIEQFLFDHGQSEDFIEQYNHLDLRAIGWLLCSLSASELAAATCHEPFAEQVLRTAANVHWKLEQYRRVHGDDVWVDSWRVPPVFIEGALCSPPQIPPHLVEGHTRLGILTGLLTINKIGLDSMHYVFLGQRVL